MPFHSEIAAPAATGLIPSILAAFGLVAHKVRGWFHR